MSLSAKAVKIPQSSLSPNVADYLIWPPHGPCVVTGMKELSYGDQRVPVLEMRLLGDFNKVLTKPIDVLQRSNVRLPATVEEIGAALRIFEKPLARRKPWKSARTSYNDWAKDGSIDSMARIIHGILSPEMDEHFAVKDDRRLTRSNLSAIELNYTERTTLDNALHHVSGELALVMGWDEPRAYHELLSNVLAPRYAKKNRVQAADALPKLAMDPEDFKAHFGALPEDIVAPGITIKPLLVRAVEAFPAANQTWRPVEPERELHMISPGRQIVVPAKTKPKTTRPKPPRAKTPREVPVPAIWPETESVIIVPEVKPAPPPETPRIELDGKIDTHAAMRPYSVKERKAPAPDPVATFGNGVAAESTAIYHKGYFRELFDAAQVAGMTEKELCAYSALRLREKTETPEIAAARMGLQPDEVTALHDSAAGKLRALFEAKGDPMARSRDVRPYAILPENAGKSLKKAAGQRYEA